MQGNPRLGTIPRDRSDLGLAVRTVPTGLPRPGSAVEAVAVADPAPDCPRVVLADGDPISRRVLGGTLRSAEQVCLVAALDTRVPVRDWASRQRPELAILVAGPQENHVQIAQELVAKGIGVLLIGVAWSKHTLDAAFASGVAGCLSKDWAVTNLGAAARAAAAGYVVLSPDLVDLCVSGFFSGNGQRTHAVVDGPALHSRLSGLTSREGEVLTLLAEGMSTAEVSASLTISSATVKSHVSHSLTKLGVRNRLEAVLLMQAALGCGLDRVPAPSYG